ncbi:DMT family transporter [Aliamphritea hakodatensis]|uniref:DMT family transporter n=1 Tax=Aliamphritea hakodatensis TaxID=2895352 RepID=UPI0022FD741A|nr:DMT family transporter [Aliamphritea hakodatensis]
MQTTLPTPLSPGEYLRGYLLVIVAAVSYGLQPLFAFQAYGDGATPLGLLLCRYIIAFTLLLIWLRWRNIALPRGKAFRQYLIIGIGYGCAALGYYTASQSTSVSLAVIVMFSFPAFITLYAMVILKDPPRTSRLLSMVMGLGGVVLAAGSDLQGDLSGIGWALFAALSYGASIIYGSHNAVSKQPLADSCVIMLGGALIFSVAILGSTLLSTGIPVSLPSGTASWLATVSLAAFATLLPAICFISGSPKTGAANAATISTLEPVVAISIAVLMIGESLPTDTLLGGMLVLAAAITLARK